MPITADRPVNASVVRTAAEKVTVACCHLANEADADAVVVVAIVEVV